MNRADRQRQKYLAAAILYIRAETADQRIRREGDCRRAAEGLDPEEIKSLTEAASRSVARGDR